MPSFDRYDIIALVWNAAELLVTGFAFGIGFSTTAALVATIDPMIVLATGMVVGAFLVLIATLMGLAIENIRFRRAINNAARKALHNFRPGQPETSAISN